MKYTSAMANQQLQKFIAHARSKGMDHSTIRMLLLSAGWKERDIAEALSAEGLSMPVPLPQDAGGARDAFFHLLTFASLYTTVISSVILLFTYINRLYPDAALGYDYGQSDLSGVRWSMAAVIVAFPLFLWLTRILLKEMSQHAEKAAGGVRRWLTYLTLFVAATALMGDVITLVFQLLQGELSIRFLLKVAVVLLVAGSVFSYYFLSLRVEPGSAKFAAVNRSFFAFAIAAVAVVLVWGAFIVGSPVAERARRFDDRRVEDFRMIVMEIENIAYDGTMKPVSPTGEMMPPSKPLPKTLEQVRAGAMYATPDIFDPETGEPYEYTVLTSTTYELCAVFSFVREEKYDILWNHPAGRHCYSIDVRKGVR